MFDLWHEIMEEGEAAIPASPSELSALEWREVGEYKAKYESTESLTRALPACATRLFNAQSGGNAIRCFHDK